MKIRTVFTFSLFILVLLMAPLADAGKPGGGGTQPTATSYVGEALGMLPGSNQSMAFGVSSNGSVVGMSAGGGGERAFYWDPRNRTLHDLTTEGATGAAHAISGGATEYAVGFERLPGGVSRAVVWIAPPSAPVALESTGSTAIGVNDFGTVVGGVNGKAAIWTLSGGRYVRTEIPSLAGSGESYATDINNDGIVIGYGYADQTYAIRSFLRLQNGQLVAIPPRSGDPESTAQAVSDVVAGSGGTQVVYVTGSSGTISSGTRDSRAVRWTINVATGAITETLTLNQTWAEGINNAGDVAGTLNSRSTQAASLFRNGGYIALKPPKGGVSSVSRNMPRLAGAVTYVAGQTTVNNWPMAVRWVVK